ncbi:uncharacterized protein isoform X2 [Leptinotarsa decemlineata]|uniref:uncharacterized protein isoform X2 n=1 Tax=Leptinotarsa decemlineata TaxID=7539 RepID=UPI000C253EDD|nr:uncharacterized protein LOC111511239 [Leptinotarsa decemlineata]
MGVKLFCVLTVVFFVCQNIPPGSAIVCYQCEEVIRSGISGCNDLKVSSVLKENCTASFVCIKYIQSDGKTSVVHRSCAPSSKCDELKGASTKYEFVTLCETCNSTLCNSGIPIKVSFWITFALSAYVVGSIF